MQDPREPSSDDISNPKQRIKKLSSEKADSLHLQENEIKEIQNVLGQLPLGKGQKASKRNLKKNGETSFQQPERSNSDLLDFTTSENEYRVLRRKFLLLEEESFALGKELRVVEDEVKNLEDEKLSLLDQLVVLEGLVGPLDMQFQEGS